MKIAPGFEPCQEVRVDELPRLGTEREVHAQDVGALGHGRGASARAAMRTGRCARFDAQLARLRARR